MIAALSPSVFLPLRASLSLGDSLFLFFSLLLFDSFANNSGWKIAAKSLNKKSGLNEISLKYGVFRLLH